MNTNLDQGDISGSCLGNIMILSTGLPGMIYYSPWYRISLKILKSTSTTFSKNFNLICGPYNNTRCLLQVTARSRNQISLWFQDLSGNKPLTVLAKKVSGPNNSDV